MGKKKTEKILDLLENESTTSDLLPRSTSYLITIWLQISLKAFREYPRGDSPGAYKIIIKMRKYEGLNSFETSCKLRCFWCDLGRTSPYKL